MTNDSDVFDIDDAKPDIVPIDVPKPVKKKTTRKKAKAKAKAAPAPEYVEASADVDCIALIVNYKQGMRAEAAKEMFAELYDFGRKAVVVKCDACGCSRAFKTEDSFPTHDTGCPCGRYNHVLIKYVKA